MDYKEIREKVEGVLEEVRNIISKNSFDNWKDEVELTDTYPTLKQFNEWCNDILQTSFVGEKLKTKPNEKRYWKVKKSIYDKLSDLYDFLNDYNDDYGKEEKDTVAYWMYEWDGEKELNPKWTLYELYRGSGTPIENWGDELE